MINVQTSQQSLKRFIFFLLQISLPLSSNRIKQTNCTCIRRINDQFHRCQLVHQNATVHPMLLKRECRISWTMMHNNFNRLSEIDEVNIFPVVVLLAPRLLSFWFIIDVIIVLSWPWMEEGQLFCHSIVKQFSCS